jgi:cysteine synthase A
MGRLSLSPDIVDKARRHAAVRRLREARVLLPTWRELAQPGPPEKFRSTLDEVDPDKPDPVNLWRVHWFNDATRRGSVDTPGHLVLPPEMTGVAAPIVVLLGRRFPMISAHKVLPAYACLVPRLVTGQFDPVAQRAIWPSTGNYCRGGVAISRILGCRGVAVLPEGMSRERFDWLDNWVSDPADIIRTPGTESNVKEIYDACNALAADPNNVILNQFSEFANYLIHNLCTGYACATVFEIARKARRSLRLSAFVSATGSAGTIGAGDHLKDRFGTKIVAVEALECPTMLRNGHGEHNIQGIGDKHIPLVHNVMNTDVVIGVSDRISDGLNLLFNSAIGQSYLSRRRRFDPELVAAFADIGISGLANIAASIKLAKHFSYGPDDAIVTIATDSAELYGSERDSYAARNFPDGLDEVNAGELFGRCLEGLADNDVLELSHRARQRIFNLGYYTWVEQQGVSLDDFERRKDQSFWRDLVSTIPAWDRLIEDMNAEVDLGAH